MLTSKQNDVAPTRHPDPPSPKLRCCADCKTTKAAVMIGMEPGKYAPAGIDPRSGWWLCGRCYSAGAVPNKLGNVSSSTS